MPLCSTIGYNLEALSDPTLSSPHNNIRMLDTEKDPSLLEKRCDSSDLQKGDTGDPSNFRPITLQPVWYKIFVSCLKTKMYEFVSANNYIDNHIQKGFWPKVDGVTEHTELLSQIILDAKMKSRGLIVTLLDLKNAFGEVHHDLIRASLNYHHLSSICTSIFNSIYHGSLTFVAVKNEWTSHLMVEPGDPCSPLMFNLCFNTLMKTLSKPEFKSLGYIWGPPSKTTTCSWLQFADDAVIIASNVKNTQQLLNICVAW